MNAKAEPPRKPNPKHVEDLLDEALNESFPASDPVAVAIEHGPFDPVAAKPRADREKKADPSGYGGPQSKPDE